MKKIFLLSMFFLLTCLGSAQSAGKISSLDDFFAGVPLKESYEKWVEYLSNHPYLGADSTTKRGVYSSMKPGLATHFPFPETILVKLLAERSVITGVVSNTPIINYTMMIEGVFGNNKNSEKAAHDCYKDLRKLIRPYYKSGSYKIQEDGYRFSNGRNPGFPDCLLTWGYSKEWEFYYVILAY